MIVKTQEALTGQPSKKKYHSYYIYRSGSRTIYMYLIFDYLRMRCTFKGKQIPVPIIFKRLQCYEVSLLFTLITCLDEENVVILGVYQCLLFMYLYVYMYLHVIVNKLIL